jgi:hypothetical protein
MQPVYLFPNLVVYVADSALQFDLSACGLAYRDGLDDVAAPTDENTLADELCLYPDRCQSGLERRKLQLADHRRVGQALRWSCAEHARQQHRGRGRAARRDGGLVGRFEHWDVRAGTCRDPSRHEANLVVLELKSNVSQCYSYSETMTYP